MRRVEFYFRETAAGIRRNGTVAFGAVSTAFIALFLFGLALLIRREISLVIEQITGNVQVAVYLEDTVHPDTITQLQSTLENLPAVGVGNVYYEDKDATCARAKKVFAANPTIIENVPCSAYPTSLRVTLNDTSQYQQITASLGCEADDTGKIACAEPGVREVVDYRAILDRLNAETLRIARHPAYLEQLKTMGTDAASSTPEAFGAFVRKYPHHKGNLTDLLIGNLFNDEVGEVFGPMDQMRAEMEAADA